MHAQPYISARAVPLTFSSFPWFLFTGSVAETRSPKSFSHELSQECHLQSRRMLTTGMMQNILNLYHTWLVASSNVSRVKGYKLGDPILDIPCSIPLSIQVFPLYFPQVWYSVNLKFKSVQTIYSTIVRAVQNIHSLYLGEIESNLEYQGKSGRKEQI